MPLETPSAYLKSTKPISRFSVEGRNQNLVKRLSFQNNIRPIIDPVVLLES